MPESEPIDSDSIDELIDEAIQSEPVKTQRTTVQSAAAILNVMVCGFSVILALPTLREGDAASGQPPFAITSVALLLAGIGVVSSHGVWQGERWGVILAIVVNGLNFLHGAPGIVFGPTTFLIAGSITCSALSGVIIYLLLRRTPISFPAEVTS